MKAGRTLRDSVDLRDAGPAVLRLYVVTPVRKLKISLKVVDNMLYVIQMCQSGTAEKAFFRKQKLYCKEKKPAAQPKTQPKVHVL